MPEEMKSKKDSDLYKKIDKVKTDLTDEIKKFKQCISYKNTFNKDIKKAKELAKSGNYTEAKSKIDDCIKTLNSISSIVDSLPNHTAYKILYSIGTVISNVSFAMIAFDKVYKSAEKSFEKMNKNNDVELYKDELKKISDTATAVTIGANTVSSLVGTKTFKDKSKKMLSKCEKKLENVKKYLDKVEKMGNEVKESLDETLNDLYVSYIEGCVDEFEYDTLVDHLLD